MKSLDILLLAVILINCAKNQKLGKSCVGLDESGQNCVKLNKTELCYSCGHLLKVTFSSTFEYEPTYHGETNTWGQWQLFQSAQSVYEYAIDFVFIKAKEGKEFKLDFTEVKDYKAAIEIGDQTEEVSISDHSAVSVGLTLTL